MSLQNIAGFTGAPGPYLQIPITVKHVTMTSIRNNPFGLPEQTNMLAKVKFESDGETYIGMDGFRDFAELYRYTKTDFPDSGSLKHLVWNPGLEKWMLEDFAGNIFAMGHDNYNFTLI